MVRWIMTAGVLAMLSVGSGCGGGDVKKETPKATVAGTVNLDGNPMDEKDGAEISFIVGGEAPATLPIKAGKFEGNAPTGDIRVEIRAFKTAPPIMMDGKPFGDPRKENFLPEKYNFNSELKATIPAAGAKDLKFDVTSM